MPKHPILHPQQQVKTNVQVPKRIKIDPLKSREEGHAPTNLAPITLGKKTYGKRGTWSEESMRLALDAVI